MSAVYNCFKFSVAKPIRICCKTASLDNDEKYLIGTDITDLLSILCAVRIDLESVAKTNSNDR